MKSQQRPFVVEFKSGRRRATPRRDSIWADTDLKALVREAEAEAPHLFVPHLVVKTLDEDSDLRPHLAPEVHLDGNAETVGDKQISAPSVEKTYAPQPGSDLTFKDVSQAKEGSSGRRSPKGAKRRSEADVRRHANGKKRVRSTRTTAAQVEALADELVALEEENRRLKNLLAKHLHQQNLQLRKMLSRFDVI